MKFIKFSFWMSAFGTMVMLGLNFSKPGPHGTMAAFKQRQQQRSMNAQNGVRTQPKRMVRIDGKYYEYNPKNVYSVNGVSTYYKPSKLEEAQQMQALQQQIQAAATTAGVQGNVNVQPSGATPNLDRVRKMADQGPLSAYGPGGMTAVMEAAKEARAKAEERNRALNRLMNE